ncbi:cadherin domain-containing protein [Luteolibacter sp. Populi]|uniref:cadherin domain-containing protein n=1 Tax=Luteolibacter sp. Populi TaxID=3230487 RepID=UPI0034669256
MKRNPAILAALLASATLGFVALHAPKPRGVVFAGGRGEIVTDNAQSGKHREQEVQGPERPGDESGMALNDSFLGEAVKDGAFHIDLPDGSVADGEATRVSSDERGVLMIEGRLLAPKPGRFFFLRQTREGVAGSLVGHLLFDGEEGAWKVEPSGPGRTPRLVKTDRDEVICVNYRRPEPMAADDAAAEFAPAAHPIDIPLPDYQDIVPLQSLPGASAVIYLDFDGEKGPFPSWGDFDAAAPGVTNEQVKVVWDMVCEDFQGFNLNITTDRRIFDNAAPGSRQHVIITPTDTAAPGAGGVAHVSTFNFTADVPCWSFYSTGKYCAEVISHEVGHTLGLAHDGRNVLPVETGEYYLGHGSGQTGWAPIMGTAYYQNVTQWSKGEYALANRTQDDLAIIVSNNDVHYRSDDTGDELETARYLEIAGDDSVSNEGIIETGADVDAFRFKTSGGAVSLRVDPVAVNPNLDVLAELVDTASGDVVAIADPDATLHATLDAVLPAGEYLLRVSGTGRGNPLLDGYTDYGSLGTYFVSGSVAGGVKPLRFAVDENSGPGSAVASVVPVEDHGSAVLTWAILSGNGSGAFAIDSNTGVLSVADASKLDFETLSTRWDDPATFELLVSITDADTPGLSEVLRVVITVADLNEAPVPATLSATVLERTRPGTALLAIPSTDADHFDLPFYAMTGGNENGWFSIDPDSGWISTSETGIGEVAEDTPVTLTIEVSDHGSPPLTGSSSVTLTVINIVSDHVPGGIVRTYYEGIPGSAVSDLTDAVAQWPERPDSEEFQPDFDSGTHGDNFGSSLHGYFIPPVSGNYRFWIASDGSSQLWLDSTPGQTGATQIASLSGSIEPHTWADGVPYRSSPIFLTAGEAFHIEALHKEASGPDHISVAFSGPGIAKQLLTGKYLAPESRNYAPSVTGHFAIGEDAFAGQEVGSVEVSDANAGDSHGGHAITAGNEDGAFSIDPGTGAIRIALAGLLDAQAVPERTLLVSVVDDGAPSRSGSGEVSIHVMPAGVIAGSGIRQQVWNGIEGTTLEDLTSSAGYPFHPDLTRTLSDFDSGANMGDHYGSRIRALVTAPASGYYTFYLASNDKAQLKLSADAGAAGAVEIASVNGWTYYNQWTKYASQESAAVYLEEGTAYYIETLQKEDAGSDHVQVAWTGPDIFTPTVIPGECLEPFDINLPPDFGQPAPLAFEVLEGLATGSVIGTVPASDPEGESVLYSFLAGDAAFAIDPASGAITVLDPGALSIGTHVLSVGAQDRGLAGTYPFKTAGIAVTITVLSTNRAPVFATGQVLREVAEDLPFEELLAATDPDDGDVLVHTKFSGPDWLTVDSDGTLHGTPQGSDIGENPFVIRATDAEGLYDEVELLITVINTNDAPLFAEDPLDGGGHGREGEAFTAGPLLASDEDADDVLVFMKIEGPEWLLVAEDGSLSGTPPAGSSGANVFKVRVSDLAGDSAEAIFQIDVEAAGLPLPWDATLVGTALEGSSSAPGEGEFLISGAGRLEARADSFQFVWQPLSGDGMITAKVDAMDDTGLLARAGVMIRDSLAANSRHVFLGLSGEGSFRWVRRTGLNGNTSTSASGSAAFPDAWVRLTRSGDVITAYKSFDGTSWVQIGSLTAALPETCYFGLAVASGSSGTLNEARFSNVSLVP